MRLVFLAILSLIPVLSFSQTEAKTSDGKEVILYDDGTWEFKKEIKEIANVSSSEISSTKSAQGNTEEIYFATSVRLDRFFGDPQNKIRGKAKCIIDNGQPKVEFTWEVYLGDGNRYFGYLKEGTPISLKLKQNNTINLSLDENVQTDVREKYKVTIFRGTSILTKDQLALLLQYPVETVSIEWKKNAEEYNLENPEFFRKELSQLLK